MLGKWWTLSCQLEISVKASFLHWRSSNQVKGSKVCWLHHDHSSYIWWSRSQSYSTLSSLLDDLLCMQWVCLAKHSNEVDSVGKGSFNMGNGLKKTNICLVELLLQGFTAVVYHDLGVFLQQAFWMLQGWQSRRRWSLLLTLGVSALMHPCITWWQGRSWGLFQPSGLFMVATSIGAHSVGHLFPCLLL